MEITIYATIVILCIIGTFRWDYNNWKKNQKLKEKQNVQLSKSDKR